MDSALDYRDRLQSFNSTDKYRREMTMLYNLINPYPNEKILDFGCGIGTCVKAFQWKFPKAIWLGYDVVDYWKDSLDEIPKELNKVYFMHSFSHIFLIEETLKQVHECLVDNGEIIIITPNPEWLWRNDIENHKKDSTVVNHYTIEKIKELLEPLFNIEIIGQFDSDFKKVSTYGNITVNERIFVKAIKK